jgi:hypothetical protein
MRLSASSALVGALCAALAFVSGVGMAQRYVATEDPAFPRLKYADSLTSANDRCIVSQAKLNPKMAPLYVNGVPIGFC